MEEEIADGDRALPLCGEVGAEEGVVAYPGVEGEQAALVEAYCSCRGRQDPHSKSCSRCCLRSV